MEKNQGGECPDVERQYSSTAHSDRFKSQSSKKTENQQNSEKTGATGS